SMEKDNEVFIILRSNDQGKSFDEIGEVKGTGNATEGQNYSFIDKEDSQDLKIFYQITQVNINETYTLSPGFALQRPENPKNKPVVFPNPYESGMLTLLVSPEAEDQASHIVVTSISGITLINETGKTRKTADGVINKLKELNPGLYLIT